MIFKVFNLCQSQRRSLMGCSCAFVSHTLSTDSYCLFLQHWRSSSWEKKALYYPAISCLSSCSQTGCITKWSRHGNKRPCLLLRRNGRCLLDTNGRMEEKERKADCFSPFSCDHVELEMDHCSNAPTGVLFFSFFQLEVSVSNNMNVNGWWESCNWEFHQFHRKKAKANSFCRGNNGLSIHSSLDSTWQFILKLNYVFQ